nr:uncharacterized protein K02A2.6-like [Quercus suber]
MEDQEKTAFVTPIGNYHYKVIPFGLKNAGSTYQRIMTRMFEPQLGKNIEIYVDDIVVKSKVVSEHLGDLGDTFDVLRKHKLRLNASKCSFGVGSAPHSVSLVLIRDDNGLQKSVYYMSKSLHEAEVRIALWNTILGALDIKYMPRTSIKGQVLVDLVAEFPKPPMEMVVEERNMDGKFVGIISALGPPC